MQLMNNSVPASSTGLVAAYTFDDANPCVNNVSQTTLNDDTGNHQGTLSNLSLTGGCTSNWAIGEGCQTKMRLTSDMGVLVGTYSASSEIEVMPGVIFGAGKNVTLSAPSVNMEMDIEVPSTSELTIAQDGCTQN